MKNLLSQFNKVMNHLENIWLNCLEGFRKTQRTPVVQFNKHFIKTQVVLYPEDRYYGCSFDAVEFVFPCRPRHYTDPILVSAHIEGCSGIPWFFLRIILASVLVDPPPTLDAGSWVPSHRNRLGPERGSSLKYALPANSTVITKDSTNDNTSRTDV